MDYILHTLSTLFEKPINSFPGNLPISLDKSMIPKIYFGYLVTLKADGEDRGFLFFIQGEVMLLTRKLQVHMLGKMPLQRDYNKYWFLFDVEVYQDQLIIFDTLVFRSRTVVEEEIGTRYELAKFFMAKGLAETEPLPMNELYKNTLPSEYPFFKAQLPSPLTSKSQQEQKKSYSLQIKPICFFINLLDMWQHRAMVSFPVDGVIFILRCCAYEPFCENPFGLIKWKPQHTLDFLISNDANIQPHVYEETKQYQLVQGDIALSVLNEDNKLEVFTCTFIDSFVIACHVVECAWSNDRWKIIRNRFDKAQPNKIDTVFRTIKSISDNIQVEDIVL